MSTDVLRELSKCPKCPKSRGAGKASHHMLKVHEIMRINFSLSSPEYAESVVDFSFLTIVSF